MSAQLTTETTEENPRLQELKQECIEFIDAVLREIENLGDEVYLISPAQLAALNVQRAQPLDIDEESIDFALRFFSPRCTLDQARQKTTAFLADHGDMLGEDVEWPKRCRRGSCTYFLGPDVVHDPDERHPLCAPEQCAELRLRWFYHVMGAYGYISCLDSPNFGVLDGSDWYYPDVAVLGPNYALNLPCHDTWHRAVMGRPRKIYFRTSNAILLKQHSEDKAQIGAVVLDSTESTEGDVLRSEVAVGVGLLRYQFRRADFLRHHTLPSLVVSLQHDRFGRITQFHFNGRSLVMRQSRLLDFWSDEPTTDAYHMIRWIDMRAIGETRLSSGIVQEQEQREVQDDLDKSNGKMHIDVRST